MTLREKLLPLCVELERIQQRLISLTYEHPTDPFVKDIMRATNHTSEALTELEFDGPSGGFLRNDVS